MRLVDMVMQAPTRLIARDPRGRVHEVAGPGSRAQELASCQLRYIIDRTASHQCGDLLKRDPDVLSGENPLIRAPAEYFWMEWFQDELAEEESNEGRQRLGVLVNASHDGRSGHLSYFNELSDGTAAESPLRLVFDLDDPPKPSLRDRRYALTNPGYAEIDAILRHSVVTVDKRWSGVEQSLTPVERSQFVRAYAQSMWIAFPLMLAFGALLNDTMVFDQRRSDLAKVNAARARRRATPLLDHIEVSLGLGHRARSSSERSGGQGSRTTPRLHYVRGHPVSRAGKTFWRTAHFRGDVDKPAARRTVNVRGNEARP